MHRRDDDDRPIVVDRTSIFSDLGRRKGHAIECGVCGGTTSEGKPYCVDHIDRMPYVAALLADLAAGIDPDSVVTHIEDGHGMTDRRPRLSFSRRSADVLRALTGESRTTHELAEHLGVSYNTVYSTAGRLVVSGLIAANTSDDDRRQKVYTITDRGREHLATLPEAEPAEQAEPAEDPHPVTVNPGTGENRGPSLSISLPPSGGQLVLVVGDLRLTLERAS